MQHQDKLLPVLFFVHGGGYQTGWSGDLGGTRSHPAESGRAIVVTMNYRLNIWGFPTTPLNENVDQNVGISDVRLALEWVAKNIAKFGGDPKRIILGGHSAGASLGEMMAYAHKEDPIIAAHLAMSHVIDIVHPEPNDGALWNFVAGSLGCGNTTDSSQVRSFVQ